MGLFTNKPQASDQVTYFSTSLHKTVLLVGLGNPGKEYDLTRHNIGFVTLDAFINSTDEMSDWQVKKDLKCELSSGILGQTKVIAIKPTTFMNNSGEAVQAVMHFYKLKPTDIVVLHDELDIDYGQIRMRTGGSSAGNNGIKSISQHIGEEYGRIRIGIGPKKPARIDSADFVLQKFTAGQQAEFTNLNREMTAIINEWLYGGQLPNDTRSFIV